MSNLVKSSHIISTQETKVIDYNEIISRKLLKIKEDIENEEQAKEAMAVSLPKNVDLASELLRDDTEPQEEVVVDEELLQSKANEIINRANEDAQAIVTRAKEEAETIKDSLAELGRKEGYEEGRRQAEEEYEALKKSLEDEKIQMEIEYNEKLNEMEPVLVETILKVFEKVTHVLAADKKDLVLQLVNDVLSKTEMSKEVLIRVSSEDYKFMLDNRDKITGAVSKQVQIEIVDDPVLKKGQCMIESDSGIYDCSLDIQLENLIESIKIMSSLVVE